MRLAICLCALFSVSALANEAADFAAIAGVVERLNGDSPEAVFSPQANSVEVRRFLAMHRLMREHAALPWSEVGHPRIKADGIRFITPDVALVNAEEWQVGVMASQGFSLFFVLRKEASEWRITSVHPVGVWPAYPISVMPVPPPR